jgi:DNA modification methylase
MSALSEVLNRVLLGSCEDLMRTLPDACFDAVVTDSPYGLGTKEPTAEEIDAYLSGSALDTGGDFMGTDWEIPPVSTWKECLRIVKPGGYVLSFAGTRTWDIMDIGMRAAGLTDEGTFARKFGPSMLQWVQGQGFPKSHNIVKSISKAIDNLTSDRTLEVWNRIYGRALLAGETYPKNAIGVGLSTLKNGSALVHATPAVALEKSLFDAITAELSSNAALLMSSGASSAPACAEVSTAQSSSRARCADKPFDAQNLSLSTDAFTVACDARGLPNGTTASRLRVAEALRILLGGARSFCEETIAAASAEILDGWKHTMCNQSETFRNCDTTQQTAYVSAIRVTTTESMAGNLISYTVDTLRKSVEQYEGFGTALKPSWEPILVFRREGDVFVRPAIDVPFFYTGKATKSETNLKNEWDASDDMVENVHPTRKPLALMRWLVKLVAPTGGVILDPYCGSGSTLHAAVEEGLNYVGMEKHPPFHEIATKRMAIVLARKQRQTAMTGLYDMMDDLPQE